MVKEETGEVVEVTNQNAQIANRGKELQFPGPAPSPAQHGHSTYPHIPGGCRCEQLHSSHLHIQNRTDPRSLSGTCTGQCPHGYHHRHTAHSHCKVSGFPQGKLQRYISTDQDKCLLALTCAMETSQSVTRHPFPLPNLYTLFLFCNCSKKVFCSKVPVPPLPQPLFSQMMVN